MDKEQLEARVRELGRDGEWLCDVPLPYGVWTGGNQGVPHTRLKRVVKAIADHAGKPLSECRILDLGCLEGQFSIELALHGADVVGIEVRAANVKKAQFLKEAYGLSNVEFHQGDARDISAEKNGHFDAIICSGLLYHLTATDAIALIERMYAMSWHCVIVDTHISIRGTDRHAENGDIYYGHYFVEHHPGDDEAEREKRRLASADNEKSFWFTRPSLVNILSKAGFTTVYEALTPAHLATWGGGMESRTRCTFVAVKSPDVSLVAAVDPRQEPWPEGMLAYAPRPPQISKIARAVDRVAKVIGR